MSVTGKSHISLFVGLVLLIALSIFAGGCTEPPPADPKVSGVGETTMSKNPSQQEIEKIRKQRMPPPGMR